MENLHLAIDQDQVRPNVAELELCSEMVPFGVKIRDTKHVDRCG